MQIVEKDAAEGGVANYLIEGLQFELEWVANRVS